MLQEGFMLRRIFIKLLVILSIGVLVSCASTDEYEDDAEIENSNSEDVAISDDSQEQGENDEDSENNNEEVNNEFNNNNNDEQYADGDEGEDGWQANNNNLQDQAAMSQNEIVEESTPMDMVEDVNGGNSVDPVLNNGTSNGNAIVNQTETETTEETTTQVPAETPSYEVGSGVVKYVTKNTSAYGEKNSSFAVGSYEVGDHPLVIDDDGTYATTSSGKIVPSNALTERAVPRPRKSIEYR